MKINVESRMFKILSHVFSGSADAIFIFQSKTNPTRLFLARPDHIIRSCFHLNRERQVTDLEVRPDECHLH